VIALAAGGGLHLSGGALLVLGAALVQATFFVSQKALLGRYGSLAVTAWAMGLGAALALPLVGGLAADVRAAPAGALTAVAFLAFGASALGFLTWAYAVARVDVTTAASTLYAVPPVAALVAWVALGEVPSALTAVGGAIALTGVAITARSRSRGSRAPRARGRPTSAGGRNQGARRSASPGEACAAGGPADRARPTPA
jgi:drug/metabolite transporter (DMT)-like permease